MRTFPESDWKKLRNIRRKALERLCETILAEVSGVIDDDSMSFHERYGKVFRVMDERDKDVELAFDNPRRSTAMGQLITMVRLDVVNQDELAEFSDSTREHVEMILREFP